VRQEKTQPHLQMLDQPGEAAQGQRVTVTIRKTFARTDTWLLKIFKLQPGGILQTWNVR